MSEIAGWVCLVGSAGALIGMLRCLSRASEGPYGDVFRGTALLRPPVPPEWRTVYTILAAVWGLAAAGLLLLAAHLLHEVEWLARLRLFDR